MNRFVILFILSVQVCQHAYAQPSKQQIRNLTAFSKIYGYIKYFHPANELQNMCYWENVSTFGIEHILAAKNDKELITELQALFYPLAPTVKIDFTTKLKDYILTDITAKQRANHVLVYWQHQGINVNSRTISPYRSIRVNSAINYDKAALPLSYVSITKVLQLEKYKGEQFVFTLDIAGQQKPGEYKDNLFAGPINGTSDLVHLNTEQKIIGDLKESFIFSGIIDEDLPLIRFGCYIDPSIEHVRIDNPQLFIVAGENKLKPVDLNIAELVDFSDNSETMPKQYAFMIGKYLHEPIFNKEIKAGEAIRKELVPDISTVVPLSLFGNGKYTYPIVDSGIVDSLCKKMNYLSDEKDKNTLVNRLACIIEAWNILEHSFPYWGDASTSPEVLLEQAIRKAFFDTSKSDFLRTLKLLTVPLNDGQLFVDFYDRSGGDNIAGIPIAATVVNDSMYVKDILDENLSKRIKIGDEIVTINERPAIEYLREQEKFISGSPQWKRSKGLKTLFNGPKHSSLKVRFKTSEREKMVQIPRGSLSTIKPAQSRVTGWINEHIYYVDLTSPKVGTERNMLEEMTKSQAIIFDMRGYSPVTISSAQILDRLLEQLAKTEIIDQRIYVPQIVYPDQDSISYQVLQHHIYPRQQDLKAKVYFLTDASVISAWETYLGIIKDHKLGTIIGQTTAGTNGTVNVLPLPGGYQLCFSGMLVKNNDGSKHHLIGISPDLEVKSSLQALKDRRDEVLEQAIELAEKETYQR